MKTTGKTRCVLVGQHIRCRKRAKKPSEWKRTKSRTITAYNLPLERAYQILYDALAPHDSGEEEEIREVVHIQVTHKRRVKGE